MAGKVPFYVSFSSGTYNISDRLVFLTWYFTFLSVLFLYNIYPILGGEKKNYIIYKVHFLTIFNMDSKYAIQKYSILYFTRPEKTFFSPPNFLVEAELSIITSKHISREHTYMAQSSNMAQSI